MFLNRVLIRYLHAQAMRGSVSCQYRLGEHYNNAELEQWPKAYAWLSIAAEQGHEKALNRSVALEAKLKAELLNIGREIKEEYKKEINKKFRAKKYFLKK